MNSVDGKHVTCIFYIMMYSHSVTWNDVEDKCNLYILDDDIQAQCTWMNSVGGEHVACPVETLVHGTCSSGSSNGTCRNMADYATQCCGMYILYNTV